MVFPDSQDSSAYNAALQAYGWLLTTPGAPLLYYGDEYGEHGGADPDNRHMYRNASSWSSMESQLFENISELGKLRSEPSPYSVVNTVLDWQCRTFLFTT